MWYLLPGSHLRSPLQGSCALFEPQAVVTLICFAIAMGYDPRFPASKGTGYFWAGQPEPARNTEVSKPGQV